MQNRYGRHKRAHQSSRKICASPRRKGVFYISQRGVQWKQGVVIYMILYTTLLYNTTPIHCTPLPLHPPFDEYPDMLEEVLETLEIHMTGDQGSWVEHLLHSAPCRGNPPHGDNDLLESCPFDSRFLVRPIREARIGKFGGSTRTDSQFQWLNFRRTTKGTLRIAWPRMLGCVDSYYMHRVSPVHGTHLSSAVSDHCVFVWLDSEAPEPRCLGLESITRKCCCKHVLGMGVVC